MTTEEGGAALPPAGSSKYDLTRTISKYLDLHMMFPLLDFVETTQIYPPDQVARARLDLLDATNMVRSAIVGNVKPGVCLSLDHTPGLRVKTLRYFHAVETS